MYRVVGANEKNVIEAGSFTEALKILYEFFPDSIAPGKILKDSEKACYIEAVGGTATARMYCPYAFEFAVKAGLIRDGKLVEPMIEPSVTELIAAFSRVAVLQFTAGMECH